MSKFLPSAGLAGASRGSVEASNESGAPLGAVDEPQGPIEHSDTPDRSPHAAVYADIAGMAASLEAVLHRQIERCDDHADGAALQAASALCCRIGYLADQALDALAAGQVCGGAREWFLSFAVDRAMAGLQTQRAASKHAANARSEA